MRRTTRIAVLLAIALGSFWAGSAYRRIQQDGSGLLTSGVTLVDRVASLRMRVAAVERENENLRTELRVRQAMARLDRRFLSDSDRIVASILEAHHRYGIPTEVLLAVIEAESGFDVHAVSSTGAVGLMQVMPDTGREVARDLDIDWTDDDLLYDPAVNIRLGSEYLHRMFERFGHADNALAAYNAGPGRVEGLNQNGILPRVYAGRVRQSLERYSR